MEHQKKRVTVELDLKDVEQKLNALSSNELSSFLRPLVKFYEWASNFLWLREQFWSKCFIYKEKKLLSPGRIIVITHKHHINKPAVFLLTSNSARQEYKVLILTDEKDQIKNNRVDLWYKMIALTKEKLFSPLGNVGHEILTITALDIFEITNKDIKIDANIIINDWEKRQMERFKNDPPCQTLATAIQELVKLSNSQSVQYLHLINDLEFVEQEMFENLQQLYKEKEKLLEYVPYVSVHNFEQNFNEVFERKHLEDKKKMLELELSDGSMALYPEYMKRIQVLKELKFVDENRQGEFRNLQCVLKFIILLFFF